MGSDLDAVVRGLMRDVGVALRPWGFSGSGGVWRLVTAAGAAVVQKQGSHASTDHSALFYLDTAVVPTVWWEWKKGPGGPPLTRAREADGLRLLEGRVRWTGGAHGDGSPDRWQVTAATGLARLRADLVAGVAGAAGRLVELLAPGRYLDELLALEDKHVGHWQALVVLLAEQGPSPRLDAACAGLREAHADRPRAAGHVDRLITWARTRAASRSPAR